MLVDDDVVVLLGVIGPSFVSPKSSSSSDVYSTTVPPGLVEKGRWSSKHRMP
jgi:hypothetical protein